MESVGDDAGGGRRGDEAVAMGQGEHHGMRYRREDNINDKSRKVRKVVVFVVMIEYLGTY